MSPHPPPELPIWLNEWTLLGIVAAVWLTVGSMIISHEGHNIPPAGLLLLLGPLSWVAGICLGLVFAGRPWLVNARTWIWWHSHEARTLTQWVGQRLAGNFDWEPHTQ